MRQDIDFRTIWNEAAKSTVWHFHGRVHVYGNIDGGTGIRRIRGEIGRIAYKRGIVACEIRGMPVAAAVLHAEIRREPSRSYA